VAKNVVLRRISQVPRTFRVAEQFAVVAPTPDPTQVHVAVPPSIGKAGVVAGAVPASQKAVAAVDGQAVVVEGNGGTSVAE